MFCTFPCQGTSAVELSACDLHKHFDALMNIQVQAFLSTLPLAYLLAAAVWTYTVRGLVSSSRCGKPGCLSEYSSSTLEHVMPDEPDCGLKTFVSGTILSWINLG